MAQILPLNSLCYVNNAGASAVCAPKCQQADPCHPVSNPHAVVGQWIRNRSAVPDPTLLPLCCLSLTLLGLQGSQPSVRCTTILMAAAAGDRMLSSLSLVCDNHECSSIADFSYIGQRWMFILPLWVLLSWPSWLALPSYPFWDFEAPF